MKRTLAFLMTWSLMSAVALPGLAQDATLADKPAVTDTKAKTDEPTQLRATMHRTLADLIEAQAAEKPDAAKIEKLTHQLQTLRSKIWNQRPAAPYAVPAGWRCPRGGPGMGYGPGMGHGRGRSGRGYGRGPGWGAGPSYGRTGGWTAGRGAGFGYGRAFIDKDRDGICDNYETFWGKR